MNTVRFNITLPIEVGKKLRYTKNKSLFIAQSIREKLEREKEVQILKKLENEYKASSEEGKRATEEWDATSGDGL